MTTQLRQESGFLKINYYYFFAALGLHCYRWAFSSCDEWGLPFIAIYSFLIAVTSLVV